MRVHAVICLWASSCLLWTRFHSFFCFLKALALITVIFISCIIKFSSLAIDHSHQYTKRWKYPSSKTNKLKKPPKPKPKTKPPPNPALNYVLPLPHSCLIKLSAGAVYTSGSYPGVILPSRGHLAISRDVLIVWTGAGMLLASCRWRSDMPFYVCDTQDSPSWPRTITSKMSVVPRFGNTTFSPLVLWSCWQLSLHSSALPSRDVCCSRGKCVPCLRNSGAESSGQFFANIMLCVSAAFDSDDHKGLFFRPFPTQLPAHTTSLVFTGCAWLDLLNVLEH